MTDRRRYTTRITTDDPESVGEALAEGWLTLPKITEGDTITAPGADGSLVSLRVVKVHRDGTFDADPV